MPGKALLSTSRASVPLAATVTAMNMPRFVNIQSYTQLASVPTTTTIGPSCCLTLIVALAQQVSNHYAGYIFVIDEQHMDFRRRKWDGMVLCPVQDIQQ